jgi:hypothetical protein
MALNVKEELKRMDADFDRQRADLLAEAPEGVNIETICANWKKMRQALEAGDRVQYEPLKSFFETVELTLSVEKRILYLDRERNIAAHSLIERRINELSSQAG